jgi:transcription termination/antitermination protein NusG
METVTFHNTASEARTRFGEGIDEPLWYAAYTSANHEKRVAEQLEVRFVEHFVPLYESVRRWKDRKVRLQLPLFPGYVFVRLALCDRLRVLQVPGVARLVGFNGLPCALPDSEIQALKAGLLRGVRAEPHPYLTVGRRVRVKSGPLEGLQGIVVRRKNRLRLIITLDLIHRAAAVEVEAVDLEPAGKANPSGEGLSSEKG